MALNKQRKPFKSYFAIMLSCQFVWTKHLRNLSRERSLREPAQESSSKCEEQEWTTQERKSHIRSETNLHFYHVFENERKTGVLVVDLCQGCYHISLLSTETLTLKGKFFKSILCKEMNKIENSSFLLWKQRRHKIF